MGISFGVLAVTPDPTAMGAGATTFSTTPMVPTYKKPALPPEPTEEELAEEEDPTKQVIKNTAIAGGVLLGSNLILKGFSNKYMKEACLSQNSAYTFSETDKDGKEIGANTNYYYVWDTKFSLKADETEKCITCCPTIKPDNFSGGVKNQADIDAANEKLKKDKEACNEKEEDSQERKDCLKTLEETASNVANCITDIDKCGSGIYNQQMTQHCSKKNFAGITPCPSKE